MALVDPGGPSAAPPAAIVSFSPAAPQALDPAIQTAMQAQLPATQPTAIVGGIPFTIYDSAPTDWYSPAALAALDTPALAAPAAAAAPAFAFTAPDVAAQTAPTVPPPFAQDFPVQAPGSFMAPIGGGGARAAGLPGAAGGFLTVNFTTAPAWSQSSRGQIAGLGAPHATYRPGLGGIGRVLAGLGLAGPHRLPRDLERHAATRTPLTP